MYSLVIDNLKRGWSLNGYGYRSNVFKPANEYFSGSVGFLNFGNLYSLNKNEFYVEINIMGNRHSIRDYPAVVYENGTKEWYHYGKLHRLIDPAVIYANGDCEWWVDGKRHGVTISCGKRYWFYDGEFIKCTV